MDELDKRIAFEKFIERVGGSVEEIEKLITFLRIEDPKQQMMLKTSIKLLYERLNKLKKSRNTKEADNYIKAKKVIKKYGKE